MGGPRRWREGRLEAEPPPIVDDEPQLTTPAAGDTAAYADLLTRGYTPAEARAALEAR